MLTYLTFWPSRKSFNFLAGIVDSFPIAYSILDFRFPRSVLNLYRLACFANVDFRKLGIVPRFVCLYIRLVHRLTRQEQLVLGVVLGLLLVGWAVKTWRTAHPPVPPGVHVNSG